MVLVTSVQYYYTDEQYHNQTICSLVDKNYKGTNIAINTVTWPHRMDKLIIEEMVEPHCMAVAKWEAMYTRNLHKVHTCF